MRILLVLAIMIPCLFTVTDYAVTENTKPSLEDELAKLKVPPDWFASVEIHYDTEHPWEEARLEIRRLLGDGKYREAMKLTYLYLQKKDIGNGHEYPMYLFMGGEYAWALQEYEKRVESKPKGVTHEYSSLAACYRHFGKYEKALETLETAMQRLPDPPWKIARQADIHDNMGDIYTEIGEIDKAKQHYHKAMELYPTSTQPYGRHLLYRQADKIQSKLNLMAYQAIESGQLRDGVYTGKSLGYAGEDLIATVTIREGKIADIQLKHKEKIDQGATTIIPQRIIEQQSLKVDGITGATVTYQAILDGTLKALKKGGLK